VVPYADRTSTNCNRWQLGPTAEEARESKNLETSQVPTVGPRVQSSCQSGRVLELRGSTSRIPRMAGADSIHRRTAANNDATEQIASINALSWPRRVYV